MVAVALFLLQRRKLNHGLCLPDFVTSLVLTILMFDRSTDLQLSVRL